MRKVILLSFVCLSVEVFAQRSFFGVDAGINVANQRMRNHYDNDPPSISIFYQNTVKPTFGIFYQYGFNEKMGLRLGAHFWGLGYSNINSFTGDVSINYLTLPLTFQYSATPHLSFNAGAYLSFTLGGSRFNNEDITKTYHHNDDGLVFGGEHDLYKNLAISVKYIWGLKNIWLNDTQTLPSIPPITIHTNYTNRALQITLIYKFKKPS
ncbi:MAG TPA: porin family protein [Cyclobacteriaceae bacterium]|jgi:hypothetical protein|nr:porin family protein [Cyclobacteriaceae bacterium]